MNFRTAAPNLLVLILAGLLVLSGCMPPQAATPEPIPVEELGDLELLIEGRIVPQQWVELSFAASGLVEEILVGVDGAVKAGDPIAQLSGAQQLSAALAASELELLSARQAFEALQDNHALLKAQAQADRIGLEQAIEQAKHALADLQETDLTEQTESARANLVLLEDRVEQAENRYEDYENYADTSLTKAQARISLAAARQQLDEGQAQIDQLETRDLALEIEKAEAGLALLQEQLAQAQAREAELKDGPSEDELALAQQRLNAAQAGVESARAALTNLRLTAPFDGVILASSLKKGQLVMSGQRAVVLADTSQWLVETDDLTEIDRVEVQVGQAVTITPDALPELAIPGRVERISAYYQENRGDITYATTIRLEPAAAELYWGMTVLINFEEE